MLGRRNIHVAGCYTASRKLIQLCCAVYELLHYLALSLRQHAVALHWQRVEVAIDICVPRQPHSNTLIAQRKLFPAEFILAEMPLMGVVAIPPLIYVLHVARRARYSLVLHFSLAHVLLAGCPIRRRD